MHKKCITVTPNALYISMLGVTLVFVVIRPDCCHHRNPSQVPNCGRKVPDSGRKVPSCGKKVPRLGISAGKIII